MPHEILAEYLPAAEAAQQLGVSKRTLKRWEQLRRGPPVTRVGRRNLYRRESLMRWLAKQEKNAPN